MSNSKIGTLHSMTTKCFTGAQIRKMQKMTPKRRSTHQKAKVGILAEMRPPLDSIKDAIYRIDCWLEKNAVDIGVR